jgi:hypothetical protein
MSFFFNEHFMSNLEKADTITDILRENYVRVTLRLLSGSVESYSGKSIKVSVRFQVLTAVSTKMAVFWVVKPCSLVEAYRHFKGVSCLHYQGGYSAKQPIRQPSSHSPP